MNIRIILLACAAMTSSPAAEEAKLALDGHDPVDYCQGLERLGDETRVATHEGFSYYFASEENLKLFESDPERWGIQWGGACARMGPLSGTGNPNRALVHDERIYIFASDQCRESFRKSPESYFWLDEPAPKPDSNAQAAGQALLARMIAAFGGEAALDGLSSYRERTEWQQEEDGEVSRQARIVIFQGRDRFRIESTWNDDKWSNILTSEHAWSESSMSPRFKLAPAQRRELSQLRDHHLIGILLARKATGFTALAAGEEGEGADRCELLRIHFDGRTTVLGIDATTARVRFLRYHGRPASGHCGEVEEQLSDWRELGALKLPARREVFLAGKPIEHATFKSATVEVGVELDAKLFTR